MSGIADIFNVATFAPIKALFGTPTALVVRPFAEWQANIPAGYTYVPEYDGFFNGSTQLTDLSPYWITDSVEYIPIQLSEDDAIIRNATRLMVANFFIGIFTAADIARFRVAYRIIIDSRLYRVFDIQVIRPDWAEVHVAAL